MGFCSSRYHWKALMSSTRRRHPFRTLLIVVVIVALLGFGADRLAESVAEGRLATVAATEAAKYDVQAADTSAEVAGFAFLPQVAKGDFTKITLTMREPTVEAVTAENLNLVMNDIHVPRSVMTGGAGTVTVDNADLQLKLSPASLTKLVAASSGYRNLSLKIVDEKLQATMTVRGLKASATVIPEARNGRLGLQVGELPGEVPSVVGEAIKAQLAKGIKLPDLPFNATLKQFAVQDQSVVLTATASNLELGS
jgi:hypothetical protein